MALFGNFFKKKVCSICGGEIGLLGNRKLEDGNMCKNCAAKLSPWFDNRRHSTVEQIRDQLEYRAENEQALESFRPTRSVGEEYKMYIEERDGVPYRFVVTDASNWKNDNPDIVLFKNIIGCRRDIERDETELKRTNDEGEEVSYVPARFEVEYDFYMELEIVDVPYFSQMRFKLNSETVSIQKVASRFNQNSDDTRDARYLMYQQMCDDIEEIVQASKGIAETQSADVPRDKFCSACGAPAGSGKFCEYCGTRLG